MAKVGTARAGAFLSVLVALALLGAFLAARAAHASSSVRVVATAKNPTLKKTVLVTRKGITLYSLSVEQKGRFICTNSQCLSFWKPLVVAKGATPTGAPKLATIRRPDGRIQVTYRGRPLYTFYLDRKRGDVKGEGFKDVGTWHAASPSAQATVAKQPTNPYGGGY
jgi:predicted lipoprotein with Yx(FWY)xxD motif